MNKNLIYGLIAVVVIGVASYFGYQYTQDQSTNTAATQESSLTSTSTPTPAPTVMESAPSQVSYQGEEGKTALALLQEKAEVEMTGEGEMAFVTAINGYQAKDNEFWSFYVNGEQAQVGAGTYVTSSSDEIMWKIETF